MLKKNIRKYKIMEQHMEFTRRGMYYEAKALFRLLRNGCVRLGLGDEDWNVEMFLESIDCPVNYSGNGYTATFKI